MNLPYFNTVCRKLVDHPRVVLCGWEDIDVMWEKLKSVPFTYIGNLRSRYGAEVFLSNLSHLPFVKQVLLVGNNGPLFDLLNHRVAPKHISIDNVDSIRATIELVEEPVEEFFEYGDRLPFELSEPKAPASYPSENDGFLIRGSDPEEVWRELVEKIGLFGRIVETKYGHWKELNGVLCCLDGLIFETPGEYTEYLRGFLEGKVEGSRSYTYYSRMEETIDGLRVQLDKENCRVVMPVWKFGDIGTLNPPCLTQLLFNKVGRMLHVTATFRSHDVFRAWKHNVYALAAFVRILCSHMGLSRLSTLSIYSQSAHIYQENWDEIGQIQVPRCFVQDKFGNFLVEKGQIKHFDCDGNLVQVIRASSVREARQKLAPFIGRVDHGLYIGEVLARVFLMNESSEVDV